MELCINQFATDQSYLIEKSADMQEWVPWSSIDPSAMDPVPGILTRWDPNPVRDRCFYRIQASNSVPISTEPENLVVNGDFSSHDVPDNVWVTMETLTGWNTTEAKFELWDGAFYEAPFPAGTQHLEILYKGITEPPYTVSTDPIILGTDISGNALQIDFDYWERGGGSYAVFNLLVNGVPQFGEGIPFGSSTDAVTHFQQSVEGLLPGDEIVLTFTETGGAISYHIANVSAMVIVDSLPLVPEIVLTELDAVGTDEQPYAPVISLTPNATSIESIAWSQVSGPSAAIIGQDGTLAPEFSGLVPGDYVFQLSVGYGNGEILTREIYLSVVPGTATGRVFHVDAVNGSDDTGNGSAVAPLASYNKVRGLMQPGDTALFHDGDYGEVVEGIITIGNIQYPDTCFSDWVTMAAAPGQQPRFTRLSFGSQGSNFKEGGSDTPDGEGLAIINIRYEGLIIEDGVEFGGCRFVDLTDCVINRAGPLNGSIANISKVGIGIRYASDINIRGCEITQVAVGLGIGRNSSRIQFVGNEIHHISHDGIQVVSAKDVLIEGNRIHNLDDGANDDDGVDWNRHCDGIHLYPEQSWHEVFRNENITIRGNFIYDCESMGIMVNDKGTLLHRNIVIENNIWGTTGGIVIHLASESYEGLTFRNNSQVHIPNRTFQSLWREVTVNSTQVQLPYWETDDSRDIEVYNNIFSSYPSMNVEMFTRFEHNAFYNTGDYRPYGLDTGSIVLEGSPFADPDSMDGQLLPGSPVIDAGTNLSMDHMTYLPPYRDIYDQIRDNRPDMGAVEVPGNAPSAQTLPDPAPVNPRYYRDTFEDLNYRVPDPFLNGPETAGLSWMRPEAFVGGGYTVQSETRYWHSNVLMGSLNSGDNAILVTTKSFNEGIFQFEGMRHSSSLDSGAVVYFVDESNYYSIDLLEGDVIRKMDGVDTVVGQLSSDLISGNTPHSWSIEFSRDGDSILISVDHNGMEVLAMEDMDPAAYTRFTQGSCGFFKTTDEQYFRMSFDNILIEDTGVMP